MCKESTAPKADVPGGRVYLDLSKVTVSKSDDTEFELTNKWWKVVVDEATGKKWSDFTPTKKGMVERTCEFMHKMKQRGIPISKIRLDPAGENKELENRVGSVAWKPLQPVDFEFTSRDTPQHNNLAELSFPYIAGKARAMMGAAHVPDDVRGKLAIEAIKCATQLDGLRVITVGGKTATRDFHVFKSNPNWAVNLRTWGEAGVVTDGPDGKSGDRGIEMMFVGYPANRESDIVSMWDPSTNGVVTTRDVIWMKRMYYERPKDEFIDIGSSPLDTEAKDADDATRSNDSSTTVEAVGSNDDLQQSTRVRWAEPISTMSLIEPEAGEAVTNASVTRSGRTVKQPTRLIEMMDVSVSAAEIRYLEAMVELDNNEVIAEGRELALVGAGIGGGFANTNELKVMNYREAMRSPDKAAWEEEIKNEYERFKKFNVVTVVPRSELPKNAKVMSTTWAMKKKTNGKRRGRLNARGYEQLEGIHYHSDSIAAPVTNPNTIRIVWTLLAMIPAWIAIVIDVEGAFLQGRFINGEQIHIDVPDGMDKFYGSREDVVLLLNVPIYGTKQAAHCFYQTLVKKVKDRSYNRSKADPCLYYIWRNGRLAVMLSWVDDILALGHPEDVKQIEEDLQSAFVSTCEGEMNEYVGNKVDVRRQSDGRARIKVTQPVLVQKLKDEFELPGGKTPKTPAEPGQVLVKEDGSAALNQQDATKYRSGTALCMYKMQWSRPDIYNATRDCARHMSAPNESHLKALRYLMKYVVGTADRGLVLFPDRMWDGSSEIKFRIHGRSDSDYAANKDDRRSISGGVVYLEGCPITFRSSTQKFVSLSVTEAESAAGVMVAQDMLYVYRLLESIGLSVELPMLLEIDNKGAVDLANNWSVGGRTRHVDVRNHFLRELKDEGLIVVKHVPGDENEADIFTKNTTATVFNKHIPNFVGIDKYMEGKYPEPGAREGVGAQFLAPDSDPG